MVVFRDRSHLCCMAHKLGKPKTRKIKAGIIEFLISNNRELPHRYLTTIDDN